MATANFKKVNARNFYVISPTKVMWDEEEEKEIVTSKDSDDYNFDIECVCERGQSEEGYAIIQHSDYVRSMGGSPIMEKTTSRQWGNKYSDLGTFDITQEIYINSGYYEGANLDWDLHIETMCGDFRLSEYNGNIDHMIENIIGEWEDWVPDWWNGGFINIQSKNLKKWLENTIKGFISETDNVCRTLCDEEYTCIGTFSNGECLYRKIG